MDRSDNYTGAYVLICMTDKQLKVLEEELPKKRKYSISVLDLPIEQAIRAVFTDLDTNLRHQKIEAFKAMHEMRLQLQKDKETVVQWLELCLPLNPVVTEEQLNDYRARLATTMEG